MNSLPPLGEPGPDLDPAQVERSSRNLMLPGFGVLGQRRLANARVLVVGAGGLGSPALLYLAAAGVGTIGVVDDDVVEVSNLQRQVIHGTGDLGRLKVDSARSAIAEVNPLVDVETHAFRLDAANALELVSGYDLVVDGSDNFATRYLVSDTAAFASVPDVWGAVLRFAGQVSVFWAPHGPSYRDLFPEPPEPGSVPSCGTAGVLGAVCGVIGAVMASEAVKLITGIGSPLLGRLQLFDALTASWREIEFERDPDASPVTMLADYDAFCGTTSGADDRDAITVEQLRALLDERAAGRADFDLIDVREAGEREIVSIPGSRSVPLADLVAGAALADLPRDRELYVYCKAGLRSAQAVDALARAGFTHATQVTGGILEWVRIVAPGRAY
ncbi:molybdopterin-synthase adenylyltransferase MoeB [Luethyella okanaganae]|uniref:Molybdopterin-synthase adenylyltransferase MoeB n=1 Tax=Luethyella okanaganae TaxID=69372 RepID=A0ABW1VFS4_9MICO